MKIWKIAAAALAAGALMLGGSAQAADNYPVKDGTGASQTICALDVAGVKSTCNVLKNAAGTTINPATSDNQLTEQGKLDTLHTDAGAPGATVCATDTGSCSLNALTQRLAQRLTTVDGHVDGLEGGLGAAGDTACATDTGSCSLNALAQRQAQRLTTLNTTLGTLATAANQSTANASLSSIDGKLILPVAGNVTVAITRPADTTTYTADDALADSTSAPTSGGFTFSSVCSASGKSGIATSLVVASTNDPTILLQGEVWVFDSSVTAFNDNAVFNTLSDTDVAKLVWVIPFTLQSTGNGTDLNSYYNVPLNVPYTCAGTANLRFVVKVKNAYVPANAEVLTFRLGYLQLN
jgi:hypothetical protein